MSLEALEQTVRNRIRTLLRYTRTVAAFFRLAMNRIMLRRLTRPTHSA